MIGETVTVLPALTYDSNGDPVEGSDAEYNIDGCAVAPGPSVSTDQRGRDGVVVVFSVYAPPGTRIGRRSRVRCRGEEFYIEGEPAVWTQAYSAIERGVVVELKRGEG